MKFLKKSFIVLVFFVGYSLFALPGFKLGVENITDSFLKQLSKDGTLNYRVGLITNQTGRDQQGRRTIDILKSKGLHIKYIFAPEHGLNGLIQAGKNVVNIMDPETGIKVVSLYGKGKGKQINKKYLKDIDVLFFDIQDSGMRHYTYISTLLFALESAGNVQKQFVVLDRPNLLGPHMEGPVVAKNQQSDSFIAKAPIPLRHGMTIGELAIFFNTKVLPKQAHLHVVKMKNYDRKSRPVHFSFPMLSPNIQTSHACKGYSFTGLLGEIRPFGVGLKSEKSFQSILLPKKLSLQKKLWDNLEKTLQKHGVNTTQYACLDKGIKGRDYHGVHIKIPDINTISSFNILIDILSFFKKTEVKLEFSKYFDNAVGTDLIRKWVHDLVDKKTLVAKINQDLQTFFVSARNSFLYNPLPKVVMVQ